MANGYARYNGLSGSGGAGAGVSSLNGETGAVNIVAGSGITVTPAGQNITIAATGGGTGTVTSVTGSSPIIITGSPTTTPNVTIQNADATHTGALTSTDWNTFNNKQSTLTLGNLTDAGTDGITVTGGTGSVVGSGTSLSQHVADTTHNGYLSSTDWNTFNTSAGAVWANQSLSNLTNPTSVNQSLIPSSGSLILGEYSGTTWLSCVTNSELTVRMLAGSSGNIYIDDPATGKQILMTAVFGNPFSTPSGASIEAAFVANYSSSGVGLYTTNNANNDATPSGSMFIETGNKTVNNANSGDIKLRTGTSHGTGTRGIISLNGSSINANSTKINNVTDPTAAQDAATKNYVDTTTTSATLTSGDIYVGNGSNVATAVAVTGAITISNAGVTSYNNLVPVTKGGTNLATLTANNVILGNGAGNPLFVAPGTSGNLLTSNGTTWTSATPSSTNVAYIREEQTSGTNGGTFTSGAWQTRVLNTKTDPNSIVTTLASNQFTIPAGTYQIEATAPAFVVNAHKAKLRNITDSTDTLIGSSENTQGNAQTSSRVCGTFTIAGSKVFEIQHQGTATSTSNGFGMASSFSVVEVYTQVMLTKIG